MNVYEVVQKNILDRLEEAINNNLDFKWIKPWKGHSIPTNYVTKKPYRGINLLLLDKAGYYLTYNQVKELKGKVKKGSKKFPVVYWNFMNVKPSTKEEEEEAQMVGSAKTKVFVKYYSVFHQSDIEGIDFPKIGKNKHEVDEESIAHKIVDGYKKVVPIKESFGSDRAFYNCETDSITIPALSQFEKKSAYYSSLFHEMIHSTGHKSRLDRDFENAINRDDYSKEELVAEIGSSLLRAYANIEDEAVDNNSVAYLKGWYECIKDAKPSFITSCAQQAQKAMDFIVKESIELSENEI